MITKIILLGALAFSSFTASAVENLDKYVGKYEDMETREVYHFVKDEVTVFMTRLCASHELKKEFNFEYYSLRGEDGKSEFGIYVNQEEGWTYIMGTDWTPVRLKKDNCYKKPELAGKYVLQQGTLSLEPHSNFLTFKNLHHTQYLPGVIEGKTLTLEWNGELRLTNYWHVTGPFLSRIQQSQSKRLRKI